MRKLPTERDKQISELLETSSKIKSKVRSLTDGTTAHPSRVIGEVNTLLDLQGRLIDTFIRDFKK